MTKVLSVGFITTFVVIVATILEALNWGDASYFILLFIMIRILGMDYDLCIMNSR